MQLHARFGHAVLCHGYGVFAGELAFNFKAAIQENSNPEEQRSEH